MARLDELRVPIRGTCMLPALRDGDVGLVRPCRVYWPGQILVFVDPAGKILCHRLLAVVRNAQGWRYYCRGDHSPGLDAPVEGARVLGRITGVLRDGQKRRLPWPGHLRAWLGSVGEVIRGR